VSSAFESRDLAAALREWAQRYGERPAVVGEHGALTFTGLDRSADAWASRLVAAGCSGGRHVGLLANNSPAWLAIAFAVWRSGATLVPISTFVTARELGEILEHADVETLLVQGRQGAHDYRSLLAELPQSVRPRQVFEVDSAAGDAPSPPGRVGPPAAIDPESIACILYTSGTTGRAKGVMLSHRAILATVAPTSERTGLTPDDSLLSTLPLFWVAGLVIRALPTLATGCALLVLERFTADAVLAALERHRPTALHLRPPQIGQLASHPRFNAAALARVRKGGGRGEWFQPHLDARTMHLITGYGMTETAGYVTALDWRDPPEVRATRIGHPLPGVELRIVGADGRPCPPDVTGEIRVRAPGLFSGYYKQAPGSGLDADGYFCTGDLGCIDAGGRFHFSGRSKDLLRVKGINVSPVEVEGVLGTHPAVDSTYVVGLPADALEQEVVALIVTRGDAPLPEAELRSLADAQLSHYKRPARYLHIARDEVPLGGTSKPQRAALAALAARRQA
jgi:fatty-acyl-CoA synthase